MLSPLLSSLLSPLLTPLLDGVAAIQRIFITADPVLETHFPLENTKTLTGDFRVGALCVLPTAATTVTLFGQLASVSNYFKVLSTGFASISIGGSVVTSTVLATKDSKLRTYDVELSGNDFLFQENGVTIDTVTDAGAAANSLVIDVIAQSNGGDFFDGTYADPKITDLTTPSNSESWKINRASPATTEQSSSGNNILTYNNAPASTRKLFVFIDGAWVGIISLWDNTPTLGTQWTDNGGGSYSMIGDGGFNQLSDNIVKLGESYLIELDVDAISGVMKVFAGAESPTFSSVGRFITTLTGVTQTTLGFSRNSGVVSCTISNILVKPIIEVA